MRAVFFGTPAFAAPALRALSQCAEVAAVYTKPDAASKRGKGLHPSPVADAAGELGLPVRKVASMRGDEVRAGFEELGADIAVVVAFGELIPAALLDLPRLGFVNVHASALPRWRGAAPVQRAILAGDSSAGVSIMRLEPTLDTGPYCAQALTPVGRKGAEELLAELGEAGARLLADVLPAIEAGTAVWTEQDPALVTYAEKIAKADVLLDPSLCADECDRRVRASSPAAPARAVVCGKPLTVLSAAAADDAIAAGEVLVTKKRLVLGCSGGALELLEVKPDGKKAMPATAFLAGLRRDGDLAWQGVAQGVS